MMTKSCTFSAAILLALAGTWAQAQTTKIGDLFSASAFSSSTAMSKPTLTATGSSLLLSDSPEELTDDLALPGAFYRDKVSGQFRVFYHHQNDSSVDLKIGLAITNTSKKSEILFGLGRGAGVNLYPDVAGQQALAAYIASEKKISILKVLAPGESYYSVQDTPIGDTASGFEEYAAVAWTGSTKLTSLPLEMLSRMATKLEVGESPLNCVLGSGFAAGSVTVTTLDYTGTTAPTTPQSVTVLAGDSHIRGTFPHFNRVGTIPISTAAGIQTLAVSTAAPGLDWSDPMPGEYEYGTDAVDGNAKVYNDGNYGVIYKFAVNFTGAQLFSAAPVGILMQPTGGAGQFVMKVNSRTLSSDYVDYTSAWWIGEVKDKAKKATVTIETSLTGGSSGPQQLIFAPGFNGK